MSTCCEDLPEIFKWNDVVKSGVLALTFNIFLLTMMYNGLGVVYILTNFVLVTTVTTIAYLAFLKFVLQTEEPKEDTQYVYISEETVQGLIIKLVNWRNSFTTYFKQVHQSVFQQLKLIAYFYIAAQVTSCFCIVTLTWLAGNALLAYGFVTFKLRIDVCDLVSKNYEKVKVQAQKVFDMIPKYEQK